MQFFCTKIKGIKYRRKFLPSVTRMTILWQNSTRFLYFWCRKMALNTVFVCTDSFVSMRLLSGAVVAEWLSSWLEEQQVRGSIPHLATWIIEISYLLLPSRDMDEIPLKRRKSSIQQTKQLTNHEVIVCSNLNANRCIFLHMAIMSVIKPQTKPTKTRYVDKSAYVHVDRYSSILKLSHIFGIFWVAVLQHALKSR